MNVVKYFFPSAQRVACFFHYKQDILWNLRLYDLYSDKVKPVSNEIIKILSSLPFIYKGNIELVNKVLDETKNLYKGHSNFIENYFKSNKM